MRLVLFILILSVFVSGYTASANAFTHMGQDAEHTHSMSGHHEASSDNDTKDASGKSFADLDCHHACSMHIALPTVSHISFFKLTAEHDALLGSHTKASVFSSLFRPPQTTA